MIVTPRELSLRSELYHQIASMLKAGLGLPSAIQQVSLKPPKYSFREPLKMIGYRLQQGDTFAQSLSQTGHWVALFDVALLEAGEKSGRLPECFEMLAKYYNERAEMVNALLFKIAYPTFLFHFALLIFPIDALIGLVRDGAVGHYLLTKVVVLVPLYAVIFLLLFSGQSRHGENWRAIIEQILSPIPILGTARRGLAVARLSAALEALLMAGVTTIQAWELSAAACGSPAINRAVRKWIPQMDRGETPSSLINRSNVFPDLFANLYHSGEVSGRLDESLRRLYDYYQDEGTRKMRTFLGVLGTTILLGVMLGVAYSIITFYMGYFQQATQGF